MEVALRHAYISAEAGDRLTENESRGLSIEVRLKRIFCKHE